MSHTNEVIACILIAVGVYCMYRGLRDLILPNHRDNERKSATTWTTAYGFDSDSTGRQKEGNTMNETEEEETIRTPNQVAVVVGLCMGFAVLFGFLEILSIVHQAIRVEAGKGDSWMAVIHLVFLMPSAIGVLVYIAMYAIAEFYLNNR